MNAQPSRLRPERVETLAFPPPNPGEQPSGRRPVRRLAVAGALLVALAGLGWAGYRYLTVGRYLVTTDNAYVKADTSLIAAKVSGYVLGVDAQENRPVKAGDVLARIDPEDYRLAREAARRRIETQAATIARIARQAEAQDAQVAQAEAQSAAVGADRTRALAEFARVETLSAQNFATPQRLDQARADRDRTSAAAAGAEAAVRAAEGARDVLRAQVVEAERQREEMRTALERAERDLEFATVRAPFDAVVAARVAQEGQFVSPGARMMALVPLDRVYVEANFKETQLARLRPGQKAAMEVDAYPGRRIEGVVDSVAPASGAQFSLLPPENATGNFTKIVQRVPVRIRLPADIAREGLMRPGLSVVVEIDTREPASHGWSKKAE